MTDSDDRIFNKLEGIHKDVNETKVDVGIIKAKVETHDDSIADLFTSRDKHAIDINTINTADKVAAKHKDSKTRRSRWLIGILITAVVTLLSLLLGGVI